MLPRGLSALFLLAVLSTPGLCAQPGWETGLRELDYLVHYDSLINIVNGIHLTREQAAKLRALALQVEAAADPPPGEQPCKAVFFLLIPGSAKVYAQHLQRLAKQEKARARTE
jgi:hypothetical protein